MRGTLTDMGYRWISFTTDYGTVDGFVAACHGVIAGIAESARVLDVSHAVPGQHVRHGAEVLAQTVPYLPGAVHLAVVDPGVGTGRRAIAVVAEHGTLVGPDNGLLLPAARALGGVCAAHELTEPAYRLPEVSATFHGRDVFAPAAAHLALGVAAHQFGPAVEDLVELPTPQHVLERGRLGAEVVTVDHFGNVALAALPEDLRAAGLGPSAVIRCGEATLPATMGRTFADVGKGAGVLLRDSGGYLAVAINHGSAARALGIDPAMPRLVCTITPD